MDSALGLEHAERVGAFDPEIHVFETGFFARLAVVLLDLPALILRVALVHAVEHRHPVARLAATLTGVELHEHVALVELAAKQRLQTQLPEELVRPGALGKRVLQGGLLGLALLHLRELKHNACVLDRLDERIERHGVGALRVGGGDHLLGLGLVVPEICARLLLFELGEPFAPVVYPHVLGHLGYGLLQRLDSRTDLLRFEEFLFCRFCHDNVPK